jgi:hypothetical protein
MFWCLLILIVNSDYVPKRHWLTDRSNGNGLCFLLGTDWMSKILSRASALFCGFSYAFHTQEWFKPGRDDAFRLRGTPPLVAFLLHTTSRCKIYRTTTNQQSSLPGIKPRYAPKSLAALQRTHRRGSSLKCRSHRNFRLYPSSGCIPAVSTVPCKEEIT